MCIHQALLIVLMKRENEQEREREREIGIKEWREGKGGRESKGRGREGRRGEGGVMKKLGPGGCSELSCLTETLG